MPVETLLAERQRHRRAFAVWLMKARGDMSWYVGEDGTVADLDGDGPVKDDAADAAGRTR